MRPHPRSDGRSAEAIAVALVGLRYPIAKAAILRHAQERARRGLADDIGPLLRQLPERSFSSLAEIVDALA